MCHWPSEINAAVYFCFLNMRSLSHGMKNSLWALVFPHSATPLPLHAEALPAQHIFHPELKPKFFIHSANPCLNSMPCTMSTPPTLSPCTLVRPPCFLTSSPPRDGLTLLTLIRAQLLHPLHAQPAFEPARSRPPTRPPRHAPTPLPTPYTEASHGPVSAAGLKER